MTLENFKELFKEKDYRAVDELKIVKIHFFISGLTEILLENHDFQIRVINHNQPGKFWDVEQVYFKEFELLVSKDEFENLNKADEKFLDSEWLQIKEERMDIERTVDEIITYTVK